MIISAFLVAAAQAPVTPTPPAVPDSFVKACFDRSTSDYERDFCRAGEQAMMVEDPLETACLEKDYSQQGMNRCEGDAYERADAALNAQWAKAKAAFDGDAEGSKLLLEAQRAWIKYRENHCLASANSSKDGSIYPMLVSGCMASLTRQRTRELVLMLEGEGN